MDGNKGIKKIMKIKEYFKVVLILPGNVLITIPLLIFLFTRNSFSYDLINFINAFDDPFKGASTYLNNGNFGKLFIKKC